MTSPRDRRHDRRRAFLGAAAAAGAGALAALAALVAGAPWIAVAALLLGFAMAVVLLNRPGGVPVIVYHSISPDASWLPWADNTSMRPETFRRHLATLKSAGWTVVSTGALLRARGGGAPLPPRSVVLHFDDGYLDNYLFAAPILREFQAPATVFASTDFIEPGDALRDDAALAGPLEWRGYMTAAELRAMDADPLFDIEAHGVDHARVPVSGRSAGVLSATDWRRHAPLAWATDPGCKARWFEADAPPPALQPGQPIPVSDSALAGRWWRNGQAEAEPDYAARVTAALSRAHAELARVLGRPPQVFAWPYDRSCPVSVAAARKAGFVAVTGGRGENRPGEDPTILSRVHVQDRAFGGGPLWLEGLALRARVNAASGRLAWHLVTAMAVRMRRRRLGPSGYGAAS